MFDFGLSYSHILVIAVIAVIAIGPKDLPAVLRRFGQFMNKMRGMAREFQGHVDNAMRDAGMGDIKKDLQGLKSGIDTSMGSAANAMTAAAAAPTSTLASPPPTMGASAGNDFAKYFGDEKPAGETRVAGRAVETPA
jgi:sec-independent protein translocase protein TatB